MQESAQWREAIAQAINGERNQLFKSLLRHCVEKKRASWSVLQKEYDIGYENIIAILDRMTEQGLVGKASVNRSRPLLNLAYETVALWDAEPKSFSLEKLEEGVALGKDEKYAEAVRIVIEMGRASTSVIQSRLRIGYGRAASIIDTMYRAGIVGPEDGSRPRQVLVKADFLERLEQIQEEGEPWWDDEEQEDDLYFRIKDWAISRKEVTTAEVVNEFNITDDAANAILVRIAAEVPAEISRTPNSWRCPKCNYQNIAVASYCTSCFAEQPYNQFPISKEIIPSESEPSKTRNPLRAKAIWIIVVVILAGAGLLDSIRRLPSGQQMPMQNADTVNPTSSIAPSSARQPKLRKSLTPEVEISEPKIESRRSRNYSASRYTLGPRGGCYYINSNGNKTYVAHSLCR